MKKIRITSFLLLLLFSGIVFSGCQSTGHQDQQAIRVAITKFKADKYAPHTYRDWLRRFDKNVQWVQLYPLTVDSAMKVLKTCDGLLCTGGGDFDPSLYGKADEISKCGPPDHHRDSLELAAIHEAVALKMPVVGICRGLQGINVALGGTLYTDLPTDIHTRVNHSNKNPKHRYHEVYLHKNSELYALSGVDSDSVYSHHHQGIDKLATGLRVGARSADSLAEAIEWADTTGKGFLMATQFHPEVMAVHDPLSESLNKKFIAEMKLYKAKQAK